jgi:prepilin-type N-terminal cleavage/methylation domain-containing protein/prepilin-type processing-associated H-X9-DG protein
MRHIRRAGMTLVELLVVVAIIGTLIALALPAVQSARERARRAQCTSHLRELGLATALHADRGGAYPIGCIGFNASQPAAGFPPAPQRFIAWNVQLLPFIDELALWQAFDFALPSDDPANKTVAATVIDLFLCPSTIEVDVWSRSGLWRGAAMTDYSGIYGVEGPGRDRPSTTEPAASNSMQTLRDDSLGVMLYDEAVRPREVTDGLSKTAVIAEAQGRRRPLMEWVNGHNLLAQEQSTPINGITGLVDEIGSPHPGGAMLVFCDGHVEFVADAIAQQALIALLTKAGGDR